MQNNNISTDKNKETNITDNTNKNKQLENEFSHIALFIILIILSAGLMIEHSRLAIIPLIIGLIYGAKILIKYLNN